jgi:uncharacterized protein
VGERGLMIHHRWVRPLADGRKLHADVRLPEGDPPRSAVLLLHGFKGFKDWGFFPWLAERLVASRMATVVPNFSLNGVGGTGTSFTDMDGFARNTFSREQAEITLLVDALRSGEMLSMPPSRVGLFGHSRGGGQAILAAVRHDVDALVTWAAVSTFHRWSAEDQARWRQVGRIHVQNQRTGQTLPLDCSLLDDLEQHAPALDIGAAAQAVRAPWLLVHGADDPVVPLREAEQLVERNPHARALILENAGHTMGATHPLTDLAPVLDQAGRATVAHFTEALGRA